MLKAQYQQLTPQAVNHLCSGSQDSEDFLVQVYNITLNKNDKLSCMLSDGFYCVKGFLRDKSLLKPEQHENALIRVKQHVVANSGKSIGVMEFQLICQYKDLIGKPEPIHEAASIGNPEEAFKIDPKNIKVRHVVMSDQNGNTPNKVKVEVKRQDKKQMRMPQARPLNGNVKDYQTIKGLFVGLKNWHLLCRVSKVDYQEFKKKNEDKIVRMLTIELIDRSEVKISGYFFYDAADKFKDFLKPNSVYKVSEGSIANQSYNNSKNDKISPFKLMFHVNSVFEEVSDVNIIAKVEDSALSLGQVLEKGVFDQEFDILGILVQIEEAKEIMKQGRTLSKVNWVIAEPLDQKRIHAIIWNDKIKSDASMVGKTILLSRFTLHNYNGSLTLNSKARSSIQIANYPPYQQLQEQAMNEHKSYELLSERRVKEEQNSGNIMKNLKELNQAIETLVMGETLKTDLDVHINRLLMKKWFYEGCPGCNKAAQKGMSCPCGKYVEETVPHFILSVQLADAFGSIYSTAYDEQAKKIFWEQEGVIHKMKQYDEKQIKDVVEDYYFQEFKLRLYTKKDHEGRIKHNMGRLESLIPQKAAMENVERIREMMGRDAL